ncbi:MAG: sialidase family protein [Streptosporangiaceae bacterium]|jgi:hypothetical protein
MGDTGRHRYGVAPPGQQRHPAGTRPEPREAQRSRATDARSRRLMLGVVTPLILAATVAVAVGETADFLVRAHVNGADAAADPRGHVSKRGMFSTVAASGETVVAVGLQDSVTPSFRVSADGGLTWTPAVVRSQAGPVAGHQATLVASGPGGWVGLGPHAIWVSSNGTTWTLISARGLAAPGETITGVTKDSWGYLATGTSTQTGTGLVWTSPNGLTWHRFTAAQFGLVDDPGERVFAMTGAGTDWSVTLIVGSATEDGKTCAYVWRSLDDGASWRTVVVPQTNGGDWSFAGLAGDAGHFIAVRPGVTPGGTPDAVVYTSDDAINWHFATTISSPAGFTPQQITAGSGGTGRFVMTGRDQEGLAVAYTSTDNGATWAQSDGFGVVPSA